MDNILQAAFIGMFAGLVCGIGPLIASLRKGREGLGITSIIMCALCGAVGGVILALPVAFIFFAVALAGPDNKMQ